MSSFFKVTKEQIDSLPDANRDMWGRMLIMFGAYMMIMWIFRKYMARRPAEPILIDRKAEEEKELIRAVDEQNEAANKKKD